MRAFSDSVSNSTSRLWRVSLTRNSAGDFRLQKAPPPGKVALGRGGVGRRRKPDRGEAGHLHGRGVLFEDVVPGLLDAADSVKHAAVRVPMKALEEDVFTVANLFLLGPTGPAASHGEREQNPWEQQEPQMHECLPVTLCRHQEPLASSGDGVLVLNPKDVSGLLFRHGTPAFQCRSLSPEGLISQWSSTPAPRPIHRAPCSRLTDLSLRELC